MKIDYEDKVDLKTSSEPRRNKVTADDMNEIKQVVNHNDTPIGSGYEYFGTTLPDNYVWADGSAISRTDYSELFEVIGTAYGEGDGATTFNVPDLRRRYPLMSSGTNNDNDKIGATGGSEGLYAMANPRGDGLNYKNAGRSFITDYWVDGWSGTSKGTGGRENSNAGIVVVGTTDPSTSREPYVICNYIIRAK